MGLSGREILCSAVSPPIPSVILGQLLSASLPSGAQNPELKDWFSELMDCCLLLAGRTGFPYTKKGTKIQTTKQKQIKCYLDHCLTICQHIPVTAVPFTSHCEVSRI